MEYKRVLVLANSMKKGGRCVAGREATTGERLDLGPWLRPISDAAEGELLPQHMALDGGGQLEPLDIVDIPDCVQVVIALVITTDGLPLAYEVMDGNTSDRTTLRAFLDRIERTYGKAKRLWVMDRGIPTEAILAEMRDPARQVSYLVGTSKSKITQYEKQWLELPWQKVRDSVDVKLFATHGELYVLAKSTGRQAKETAMRRKRLVRLLRKLRAMRPSALARFDPGVLSKSGPS